MALAALVAAATALGSIGGGELGRRVGVASGHVGDELVFDALGGGALAALVLAFAVGILGAPRLGVSRWIGAGMAACCLFLLACIFMH